MTNGNGNNGNGHKRFKKVGYNAFVEMNRDGTANFVQGGVAYRIPSEDAEKYGKVMSQALEQMHSPRGTYLGDGVRVLRENGRQFTFVGGKVVEVRAYRPIV